MPPEVPSELTDPREAELWRNIVRLFEGYLPSDDPDDYEAAGEIKRIKSFFKVVKLVTDQLQESRSDLTSKEGE